MRPVEAGLGTLEILLRYLQSLLGSDRLVGECNLLRALQLCLSTLEVLLQRLQVGLLTTIEGRLTGHEALLVLLQTRLLRAIQRRLCALKILLSGLQGLLGLNRLVRQRNLLSALKSALRGGEVLLCHLKVARELLATQTLGCLEAAVNPGLLGLESLIPRLQAKLVDLAGVELAAGVQGVLVVLRSLVESVGILLRDRRSAVDHRGHPCTRSHGAVDQATLRHVLGGQCAGALHQWAVFGQDRVNPALHRIGRRVDLACRRGVSRHVGGGRCRSADVARQLARGGGLLRHSATHDARVGRLRLLRVKRIIGDSCCHWTASS